MALKYNRLAEINRSPSMTANDAVLVEQGNVVVRVPVPVAAEALGGKGIDLPEAVAQQVYQNKDAIDELKEETSEIDKHFGIYDKEESITFDNEVATNKMLTTNDSGAVVQVAKAGWAIHRIKAGDFTFGDTAFLKMLSAQGQNLMVEGAVLFASEEEIKDKDGNVITTRLTSLFRASNTDIPESGYVVKTLSLKGKNLLVSHPAVITELVMGRSGVGASMATLEANLQNEIDEKANLSGFHGAMITGGAISLVPEKADDAMPAYTENLPAARMVGDAGALTDQTFAQGVYPHYPHVPDDAKGKRSSLSIERVEGECLGVNQMVPLNRKSSSGTLSKQFYYTQQDLLAQVYATHRYFMMIGLEKDNIPGFVRLSYQNLLGQYQQGDLKVSGNNYYGVFTINETSKNMGFVIFCQDKQTSTVPFTWQDASLLDLTTLFPTPSGQAFVSKLKNNQSSALAVCNKLGYASVITYDE